MKKALAFILVVILGSFGIMHAEILPPHGEGQIGLEAVILCERLALFRAPGGEAEAVGVLRYGDSIVVLKQSDGWAEVFTSDAVDADPAGWVNTDYIMIDPAWYRTEEATPVYAWNDTDAPKVDLLEKDTILPILKTDGDWLVVSLRGATGWIHQDPAN